MRNRIWQIIAFGLLGCTALWLTWRWVAFSTDLDAEVEVILPAPGWYRSVAWLTDDLIVVQIDLPDQPRAFNGRLWLLSLSSNEMELLNLPGQPDCEKQGFEAPARLPDGRLEYIIPCSVEAFSPLKLYIMGYDYSTQQTEELLEDAIPTSVIGTGGFVQAWNPEMTRGITSRGAPVLNLDLYWFTKDTWEKVELNFPVSFAANWSPNGYVISFVAAQAEMQSPHEPIPPRSLYLMDADGSNVRVLIKGPLFSTGAVWSPDSQWLVSAGSIERGLFTRSGLWLVNAQTGDYYLIARGNFISPAWSPDGNSIVATRIVGDDFDRDNEVVIIRNIHFPDD